jgi:hypothetical protein
LRVYDIKSYENRNNSKKNRLSYKIEGRFDNFPIDGRDLSGRFETNLVIRKNGLFFFVSYEIKKEDQKEEIVLKVDDMLSNEMRDSMVADYINRTYNNPVSISIADEILEVHPDEILRYVSAVTNSKNVVYAKVIFKPESSKRTPYTGIVVQQQQWIRSSAEVLFEALLPTKKQIDHEMADDMFRHFSRTYPNIMSITSGVKAIDSDDVIRATHGAVKLKVTGAYNVGEFLRLWKSINFTASVSYEYDTTKKQWHYIGTEDIDP